MTALWVLTDGSSKHIWRFQSSVKVAVFFFFFCQPGGEFRYFPCRIFWGSVCRVQAVNTSSPGRTGPDWTHECVRKPVRASRMCWRQAVNRGLFFGIINGSVLLRWNPKNLMITIIWAQIIKAGKKKSLLTKKTYSSIFNCCGNFGKIYLYIYLFIYLFLYFI